MQVKTLALAALASSAAAQSLTEALSSQPSLSNLTTYLGLFPDLVSTLSAASNITLLAPNNDAFTAILSTGEVSINDTALIQALFSYHVLQGTHTNFTTIPEFIPTLLTQPAFTNVTGGQVVEAVRKHNTTYFYSALRQKSTAVNKTIKFTGGAIHIIDTFLTLPQNISTTAVAANLTAVVGALHAADLATTLDSLTDVTVFAPSNAAFQAIGSALAGLSTKDLTSILEYHVINGTVAYSTTLTNMTIPTLQGGNVTIEVVDGAVFVNSARVIIPDVLVANGVVHVIDAVLNPNNTTQAPNPTQTIAPPAFSGASSISNVPFTSGVPTPTAGATSTAGAAGPIRTAAIGMGALLGGAAAVMNL
jgi:uncharacterized surface protein with fasciclin (FAS1) repeats